MQSKNPFVAIKKQVSDLSTQDRIHFFILSLVMFTLLFSYPLVRSTTTVIFLETAGAAKSPLVWIYSVAVLGGMVSIKNKLQMHFSLQAIFSSVIALTLVLMSTALFFQDKFLGIGAYLLYVSKEVYIVLCVHMILGYLNSSLTTEQAKLFYGPLGAIGSLGGILGGLFTTLLATWLDNSTILLIGLALVAFSALCFYFTDHKYNLHLEEQQVSPLKSINSVKQYVTIIIGIIVLSQFCISIANFKFNLVFEQLVPNSQQKTAYLGMIYSLINTVSLLTQFLVIPLVFHRYKMNQIHLALPLLFSFCTLLMLVGSSSVLFLVAAGFMLMKAFDYSIVSAAKELLYFPLSVQQKYGAKYLADMIFYRFAKGLISAVLLFFQSHLAVNLLLGLSLLSWGALAYTLKKRLDTF